MTEDIKRFSFNLRKYFNYAIYSAKSELKSEVVDSYLNWLWWIIEPLAFTTIYTFIFSYVFRNQEPYIIPFILIGITTWDFFNRMISGSVKTIVNNRELVTKVYIPKYILLLAKSFTYLFKYFISYGLVILMMIISRTPFNATIFYFIPITFILYLITFGFGCILMHYGVYVQDLTNLTTIVLKFVFYLSGVFYNIRTRLSGLPQTILLRANPVAFLMDEFRKVMIGGIAPSFKGLLLWLVIGIVVTIIGVTMVHKNENSYVKVI